jgi:hypothetical protein
MLRAFKGHDLGVISVAISPDAAQDRPLPTILEGNLFDIACAWLPDHDLSRLSKDYGLDLTQEAPICQKDASGKFTTPLPDPAAE